MYATCLFCNTPFERNESIEAFPVGRRLAFDAAKGRLWVVCRKCERWCLSPLDERWEAIEQAERLYRDTRRRVSTDNIGLAKVAEGTTLVRIGNPLRPEFAAWRYGDQFGRRRRKQMLLTGAGVTAAGAFIVGGALATAGLGSVWWMFINAGQHIFSGNPDKVVATIRDSREGLLEVRRKHLAETVMSRTVTGSMVLDLRYKGATRFLGGETTEVTRFVGLEAQRVAAILLPHVNRYGAGKQAVADAVSRIESAGSTQHFVDYITGAASDYTRPPKKSFWSVDPGMTKKGLFALPGPDRLALEMALHEEAERRAMHGELAELERAWRDAEDIAAIADNLTVPDSVIAELDRLKKR